MCDYQWLHWVTTLFAVNALVLLFDGEKKRKTVVLTDITFTFSFQFLAHLLQSCPFLTPHPLHRSPLHISSERNRASQDTFSVCCSCFNTYRHLTALFCTQKLTDRHSCRSDWQEKQERHLSHSERIVNWTPSQGKLRHHWDWNSQSPDDEVRPRSHFSTCDTKLYHCLLLRYYWHKGLKRFIWILK